MCRITRAAVLLATCLVLAGTSVGVAAAAGPVPSHLTVGVNNPSCVGCTVSMTLSLSFDDYADPTGSVVHATRTVGEVTTALPDVIVGSGIWPWVYDSPTVEGLYHYVFSFDGDAATRRPRAARMSRSSAVRCRSV